MSPQTTPQEIDGLTSTSEWTGVPLATLLAEAGVRPGARWLLAEGGDAAVMTRSIPLAKGLDDALVAYVQNGEPLRPEQGFPVRLLLPGWEGNTNIKWLRRIKVGDEPFMTREETAPLHGCAARRGGSPVQLRDGRQVDHHVPRLPDRATRSRLVGDPWHRLVGTRADRGGRRQYRWRCDVVVC